MDLRAIVAQLPSDPKVQLHNVDIGLFDTWKDGDWISVRTMVHRYPPDDHLILVSRNVQAVFGPGARIVTNRVLDEISKLTPVDIWYQVFDRDSEFGVCNSDTDSDFEDFSLNERHCEYYDRDEDGSFLGQEFKKATLRRIAPDEDIREDWLLDEDVSGPLAFENPEIVEAKQRQGALIEMTDETGTYILDVKKRRDEDFFFFHPHEPLVVTFV